MIFFVLTRGGNGSRRHAPDPSGYGDTLYNMGQGVSFVTSKFSAAGLGPIVRRIKLRCVANDQGAMRSSGTRIRGGGYSIIQFRS